MAYFQMIDEGTFRSHTPEWAIEGDSRAASAYTGLTQKNGHGLAFAVESASRGRVRIPADLCFGVSGNRTADVLARANTVAQSRASGVILFVGTNDITTIDPNITQSNLTATINTYLSGGKAVIIINEIPRGSGFAFSGANLATHLRLVKWFSSWSNVPGVFVADCWQLFVNPTSATALANTGLLYDDLHQSPAGAWRIAQRVALILASLYPEPHQLLVSSNADLYAATNPSGNQIGNGMMSGTAGTASTEITGNVADGWTVSRSGSGFTAAVAKSTLASGAAAQQITLNGTSATVSPYVLLTRQMSAANLSAGDLIEGIVEYEIDASAANVDQPWLQISVAGNTTAYAVSGYALGVGDCPTFATSGIFRTPPLTVPQGTLTFLPFNFFWNGRNGAAASGVIRLGRASIRKLISTDRS